ncbi:MAG: PEP-CTERM sorting domain-containing protein, partial [Duganella sp.]
RAPPDANWLGAGGYAYNSRSMLWGAGSTTEYTVTTGAGQHLLLGLFGGQGIVDGTYAIDFTVRNNGVVLFTQYFDDAALAGLKGAQLLDLGVLGAGLQNLALSTEWYIGGIDTAYGFQYVMGVSAVPEPTTWLAMLLGLGTLVMAARRRRQ